MKEIKLSDIELYPIVVNPISLNKFKVLKKEEVVGVEDAFLLFVSILQWNKLEIEWDLETVYQEIGFTLEYAEELLDFMIDEKLLNMR